MLRENELDLDNWKTSEVTRLPHAGFSTASGKTVVISQKALQKARNLWKNCELDVEEEPPSPKPNEEEITQCRGNSDIAIATSSEKLIRVFEEPGRKDDEKDEKKSFGITGEALKKIEGRSRSSDNANDNDNDYEVSAETSKQKAHLGVFGMTEENSIRIISDKEVPKVPEDALKKPRKLLNDHDEQADKVPKKYLHHGGFSTAGGKPVSISEEALTIARNLWKDDDDQDQYQDQKQNDKLTSKKWTNPNPLVGFATAGGKPVSVSEEALKKAKSLWNEQFDDEQELPKTNKASDIDFIADGYGHPESESEPDSKSNGKISTVTPNIHMNTQVKVEQVINSKVKSTSKGFVTPYLTRIQGTGTGQGQSDSNSSNSNKNTPILQGRHRHPGLARSSGRGKGVGMRLDQTATLRSAESLKRSRCSLGDIGNSNNSTSTCNKTPKLNSTNSPCDVNVNSTTFLSASVGGDPKTPSSRSIDTSCVTESQMTEVLESSKALLNDDDFDSDSNNADNDNRNTDACQNKSMEMSLENNVSIAKPISIGSIITADKNPIHRMHALVVRSYPLIYVCKTSEGKTEFLSQSAYEKLESTRESTRQAEMEKLFAQIEAEYQNARKSKLQVPLQHLKKSNLENLSIDDLLSIIESGDDFGDVRSLLSVQKLTQLCEAQEKRREGYVREIQKEVEKRMKNLVCGFASATVAKRIRLVDLTDVERFRESVLRGSNPPRHAVLTLWRPSEDWQNNLVESLAVEIFGAVPSQVLHNEVRLNSGRGTVIHPLPNELNNLHLGDENHPLSHFHRRCFAFDEISNYNHFYPPFGEFDIVGLIVQIEPASSTMGEIVYLADEHTNCLSIKFWKSILGEGLAGLIQVGNLIAVNNLQWRESSKTERIPVGFVQETTKFSLRPNEIYMKGQLERLKNQIGDIRNRVSLGEERIYAILNNLEEDDDDNDDIEKSPTLKRHIQPYFQLSPQIRKNLMETDDI